MAQHTNQLYDFAQFVDKFIERTKLKKTDYQTELHMDEITALLTEHKNYFQYIPYTGSQLYQHLIIVPYTVTGQEQFELRLYFDGDRTLTFYKAIVDK